jgi:hypothetical protein
VVRCTLPRSPHATAPASLRAAQAYTITKHASLLGCPTVLFCLQDITQLRKLAAVRGLVNAELRAKLWPRLLAGQAGFPALPAAAAAGAAGSTSTAASNLSHHISSSGLTRRLSVSSPVAGSGQHNSSSSGGGSAAGKADALEQYLEWAAGTHKDSNTVSMLQMYNGCRFDSSSLCMARPCYRHVCTTMMVTPSHCRSTAVLHLGASITDSLSFSPVLPACVPP